MENVQSSNKKVWVDGDSLVRRLGEAEAHDYLHGSGFQAKLTKFIKERDRKLAEEQLKYTKKQKIVESEPGLE